MSAGAFSLSLALALSLSGGGSTEATVIAGFQCGSVAAPHNVGQGKERGVALEQVQPSFYGSRVWVLQNSSKTGLDYKMALR